MKKAGNIDINERYFLRKKQEIYDSFKVEAEQVIKDREMMAGCRAQWMLLVALVRKGFGKKRLRDVLTEIETILPSLIEDREAEVMDEDHDIFFFLQMIGQLLHEVPELFPGPSYYSIIVQLELPDVHYRLFYFLQA